MRESSDAIRRRLEREYVLMRSPVELDAASAGELEERLMAIDPNTDVVIDMCDLECCDLAAVRVLLRGQERFAPLGGSVTLRSPPPVVERLLADSGLDKHFAIRRERVARTRRPRGVDPARR